MEESRYEMAMQSYQHEHMRWTDRAETYKQSTKEKLYNVLLFPEGFFLDQLTDPGNESRACELELLRKICLPDVCLRLHRVLHESEEYMEV